MSRFTCLELDSVSTSEENSVVGDYTGVENTVENVDIEENNETSYTENAQLTAENLTKLGDVSLAENPFQPTTCDPVITTARNLLLAMTKGYHKIKPLRDLDIFHPHQFTSYMSEKTQSYFTELYSDSVGDYSGSVASIYSWKYGKNQDGSPLYLYISSTDRYVGCSCCGYSPQDNALSTLTGITNHIRTMMETVNFLNSQVEGRTEEYKGRLFHDIIWKDETERLSLVSKYKKMIAERITEAREFTKAYIENTIKELIITRSYDEAVRKIKRFDQDFNPPRFLSALKKAFPNKDFSSMEKKIQEKAEQRRKLVKGQRPNLISDYIKGFPLKK